MDARLQRRVQRYGWDLATEHYEALWQEQLAPAHAAVLDLAALAPGEHVLDVACGSGQLTFEAARQVGATGAVTGVDLSGEMIARAQRFAPQRCPHPVQLQRMDAEALAFADASFDVVLCGLGLMYMPDPALALREMRRVLKPGGRVVLAVWGERAQCGWAGVFPIVDAHVASEVCPLFFGLGQDDALARLCEDSGFAHAGVLRIAARLRYADAQQACLAALVGGP
ncbi:MAG TPA: methyltransferase domain-containing protein, partial [Burkholderiaceae bacterium]